MHAPLSRDVKVWNELKDRLKAFYGLEEHDEALQDTLDGELPLRERLIAMAREIKLRDANAKALGPLIDDMRDRRARIKDGTDRMRQWLAWAMEETGLSKVTAPDLTLSERMGAKGLSLDPEAIEPQFLKTIIRYEPDKERIEEALSAGHPVKGASFTNPQPVLTIRSK